MGGVIIKKKLYADDNCVILFQTYYADICCGQL